MTAKASQSNMCEENPVLISSNSLYLYLTSADVKLKYPNFFGLTTRIWVLLAFGGIRSILTTVWPPAMSKSLGTNPT